MTIVSTSHLPAGEPVLTTDVVGTDFGLPLVRPTRTRQGSQVRVVRSRCRAHGGVVVWFTDGTKTPPLHGRTAWIVAGPEQGAHTPARVPAWPGPGTCALRPVTARGPGRSR